MPCLKGQLPDPPFLIAPPKVYLLLNHVNPTPKIRGGGEKKVLMCHINRERLMGLHLGKEMDLDKVMMKISFPYFLLGFYSRLKFSTKYNEVE